VSLWAVVPVKPLDQAKSRLAGALSPVERVALVQQLLERTLDVLRQVPAIAEIVVATSDPGVAAWARREGYRVLREVGEPDLNGALAVATRSAQSHRVDAVLIVHADLPRVTPADVVKLAAFTAGGAPVVVVAPDRHGRGTNALLCAPPGLIEYRFGEDSYAQHCAQAQAAGARLEICSTPGLALDLDVPEDLEVLRGASVPPPVPPGREP
jgi:2-phospho-L-lactate guanylyltransferase